MGTSPSSYIQVLLVKYGILISGVLFFSVFHDSSANVFQGNLENLMLSWLSHKLQKRSIMLKVLKRSGPS